MGRANRAWCASTWRIEGDTATPSPRFPNRTWGTLRVCSTREDRGVYGSVPGVAQERMARQSGPLTWISHRSYEVLLPLLRGAGHRQIPGASPVHGEGAVVRIDLDGKPEVRGDGEVWNVHSVCRFKTIRHENERVRLPRNRQHKCGLSIEGRLF